MVRIIKSHEPHELAIFRNKAGSTYASMDAETKKKVYQSLCRKQFGLCAYCMCRIFAYSGRQDETLGTEKEYSSLMHIEHFIPQSDAAFGVAKSLDYNNMLAVCDGGVRYNMGMNLIGGQNLSCDASKGEQRLSLNPAVKGDSQRMRIHYTSSCRIKSDNEQFDKEINNILNLNVKRLVNLRKSAKQVIIKSLREGKIQAKNKKAIISSLQLAQNGWKTPFYSVSVYFVELLCPDK